MRSEEIRDSQCFSSKNEPALLSTCGVLAKIDRPLFLSSGWFNQCTFDILPNFTSQLTAPLQYMVLIIDRHDTLSTRRRTAPRLASNKRLTNQMKKKLFQQGVETRQLKEKNVCASVF